MGHESTDGGDRSVYGNGGYNNPYAVHNPYCDANPSSYEDYSKFTLTCSFETPPCLGNGVSIPIQVTYAAASLLFQRLNVRPLQHYDYDSENVLN